MKKWVVTDSFNVGETELYVHNKVTARGILYADYWDGYYFEDEIFDSREDAVVYANKMINDKIAELEKKKMEINTNA